MLDFAILEVAGLHWIASRLYKKAWDNSIELGQNANAAKLT
jgi:hypothetical protein